MVKLSKKFKRGLFRFLVLAFILLNGLSYVGAYTLTHFNSPGQWGLGLPRPMNTKVPTAVGLEYVTQRIPINQQEWLETWFIPVQAATPKGTILLFPGHQGSKQQVLASSKAFHELGYDTLLVDFRGVGGSSGKTSTVGIHESQDVAAAFKYAQRAKLQPPLILYGISMGSAAVLRSIAQEKVAPDAIILEQPFARFVDAIRVRLRAVKIPTFPIAELLIFWGGVQQKIDGFAHNPVTYAKQVKCPTLVLQGKLDQWVTMKEVQQIVQNLREPKQLVIFPKARHHLLISVDKPYWRQSIQRFLDSI